MIRRGGTFLQDNGGRRKPPGRAVRPWNEPLSDTNHTLVPTDRGVFACSHARTKEAVRCAVAALREARFYLTPRRNDATKERHVRGGFGR